MGDTTEASTKVLSGELLGVVAQQTPIQKYHYMHKMCPFPKYSQSGIA